MFPNTDTQEIIHDPTIEAEDAKLKQDKTLVAEYKEVFEKKPHHKMSNESIKQAIDTELSK